MVRWEPMQLNTRSQSIDFKEGVLLAAVKCDSSLKIATRGPQFPTCCSSVKWQCQESDHVSGLIPGIVAFLAHF